MVLNEPGSGLLEIKSQSQPAQDPCLIIDLGSGLFFDNCETMTLFLPPDKKKDDFSLSSSHCVTMTLAKLKMTC